MALSPDTAKSRIPLVEISLVIALIVIAILAFLLGSLRKAEEAFFSGTPVECGNMFLGPDDFEGDWVPAPSTPVVWGASTIFNGKIFVTNVDRRLVENILPVNWTLAEPVESSEPCHPVLILYGDQTDTSAIIGGIDIDIGGDDDAYQEMMLLVPFAQRDFLGPLWHTAVIRMYLDDQVATDLGNKYYGYAKELATLTQSSSSIDVYHQGLIVFQAMTSSPGAWQDVSAATIGNLDDIQSILAMPLFGVRKSSAAIGGEYDICSYFRMTYVPTTGTEASVRTLTVQHDYMAPFVPTMVNWVSLPVLTNSMNGAIEIRNLSWRLVFPANAYCKYSP